MHQNYNRYSYVLNNPLKYTDPSGWKYEIYKDNKVDDPPINFDNFSSNYGGSGGGGGSYNDIFSFGNSNSSPYYNWSTGQYMQGGQYINYNTALNYYANKYPNSVTSYQITTWDNWAGTTSNPNAIYNGRDYTISQIYQNPTISNYSGNTNIQYAGMFGGNPTTERDFVNYLNVMAGSTATYAEIILRNEKGKLEKAIANGQKVAHKLKLINTDINNIGKFSQKLGVAGLILQSGFAANDYFNGSGITSGQIFDMAFTSGLLYLSISNPIVLSGLAAYSLLDMTGALDGIKGALGGNMIIIQGYSKQK